MEIGYSYPPYSLIPLYPYPLFPNTFPIHKFSDFFKNEAPRHKRTGYLSGNYFPIVVSDGEPACRLAGITLKIPRLRSGSLPCR